MFEYDITFRIKTIHEISMVDTIMDLITNIGRSPSQAHELMDIVIKSREALEVMEIKKREV